jgi:hypothetical protein
MDNKANFVAAAMGDVQSTIRAVDVKVAAILVLVLAPLQNLNRVFSHLNHFGSHDPRWLFVGISSIFVLSWVLAVVTLVRAIAAIDNPAAHIINSGNCKGTFYSGGLYPLSFSDAFLNRDVIMAKKDSLSFYNSLPTNTAEIELELAFEQMKLVYIRDMKLKRLYWGTKFTEVWLIFGVGIYLISKYWW